MNRLYCLLAVLLLLTVIDVFDLGHDPEYDLRMAVIVGDIDKVRSLLDAGADVNAANEDGWTPLMSAVLGENPSIAAMLIDHGADVNAATEGGWTTTLELAESQAMIELLQAAGAVSP